jgi:hypothetical protein
MKTVLLWVISSVLFVGSTNAQWYVSKSGSDGNPGSLSQPFLTIQKAADVMQPGDSCLIMAGVYHETVIPANNGTNAAHIIFKNYQNDKVIVVGMDSISGWVPYQNGIYKAYAPDTVLQLCVNKKMAIEAQYPNFNNNRLSTAGWKPCTISTNGNAVYTAMNFPLNYWVGGFAVANVASRWITEIGRIDSSGGNTVHCTDRSTPWLTYTSSYYIGSGSGYITHHLNALDTINEWHWQNDTLYYYPQNPSMITTMNAQARTRMYGFDCSNKEYIDINNIQFVWATVNFEEATGCTLDGGSVWYPAPFFYWTQAWDRQAHDSINYGISSWTGKGVAMSGYNNTIKNCYIAHSWGDGVSIGGQFNTVDNCLVENCDWSGTDDAPLTTVGYGHNITHCTMRNSGRSTLVNRLSNLTNIMYNDMHDCGFLTLDLGITYSYHSNGGGSQIAYNYVHDNHSTSSSMGIYLDNYDTAYIVHHNVIWNCINAVQTNTPAVDHQIYNNTAWYCTNAMGSWGNPGTYIVNQIVKNNLSHLPWNQGTTFSNNLVTTSPQFTNSALHDFTLTVSSPAIDYGVNIPGITTGYAGVAPDAGAYEYGNTPWIAGSTVQIPDITEVFDDSAATTGITEIDFKNNSNSITIYPNPSNNEISIVYDDIKHSKVVLYDVNGKLIFEKSGCHAINVATYNRGLYLVKLINLKTNQSFEKIVVKE